MTCSHCGIVLLTAVVAGTRDEQYLANLTSLPLPFVKFVCALGVSEHIWWSSWLFQLRQALPKDLEDFEDIRTCLTEVDLTFWQPEFEPALTLFRCGHQFGNNMESHIVAVEAGAKKHAALGVALYSASIRREYRDIEAGLAVARIVFEFVPLPSQLGMSMLVALTP